MSAPKKKGAAPGQEPAPSTFRCSYDHTTKLIRELASNGLALASIGATTLQETEERFRRHPEWRTA